MTAPEFYLGGDGTRRDRAGHVAYLRRCAESWRAQPAMTGQAKAANEHQAERVEAMASEIESQ